MMSLFSRVRQTFSHILRHKDAPESKISGSDLQDLLLISPLLFDNLFQRQVESWNETHDQFDVEPSLQRLAIQHNKLSKLTFYQLYREDAFCLRIEYGTACPDPFGVFGAREWVSPAPALPGLLSTCFNPY
jgi:hypothetical protein